MIDQHKTAYVDGELVQITESTVIDDIEPLELPDDQAERDAAIAAINWMCQAIGSGGIVAKILALRFLLHLESESMDKVGKRYGLTRAAISKYVSQFATAFNMPAGKSESAREIYSDVQRRVWKSGTRKPRNPVERRTAETIPPHTPVPLPCPR